jgi:hypothetical protein
MESTISKLLASYEKGGVRPGNGCVSVAVSLGKGRIVPRNGTPAAIADLKARGAIPLEGGDAAFHVVDPDGYPVQLISNEAA